MTRSGLKTSFILLAVSLFCACAREAPVPAVPLPKRIVDLSPTITEDLPVRLLGSKFLKDFGIPERSRFEVHTEEEPIYLADARLTLYNHVGPHHDPPNHVIKGAKSSDQFPLEKFFGRARVMDFRAKPKDQPLLPADFEGQGIQAGDIVIAFVGYAPPGDPQELPSYAYLSGEAAEYLAGIPIKAFGSDMPSLGSIRKYYELMQQGVKGSDKFLPEHYAFLSREIPNIEGLANLESLVGEKDVFFAGFPLKIQDGNGAPMRPVALVY
jgi:kynurenine formamidase